MQELRRRLLLSRNERVKLENEMMQAIAGDWSAAPVVIDPLPH
jgi:hypothetical protein